ncbi:FAD-dependent oxidoreductase, partial [Bradyrhizobium sp. UFLA05-153]
LWGRASSAAAGSLARYRERARVKERERDAKLAAANRAAGTGPRRAPPGAVRPVRPAPPPEPAPRAEEAVSEEQGVSQ